MCQVLDECAQTLATTHRGGVAACRAAEPGMMQSNYVVDYDYREDN